VRRALARAHVLTLSEVETISAHYRLPRERFVYVPWPLATEPLGELPDLPSDPLVLSSGRAYCDWPTLFAAADGAGWRLVVVCGRRDQDLVEQLNRDAGSPADVRCEIAREDFAQIMRQATVSVVAMVERRRSQGQVRVGDAAVAGVPIVATATVGLDGYVVDGVSGLLVEPRDPQALREAVDRVLHDRELAERLRQGAWDRAARYGAGEYFAALESFLRDEPVRLPPGAPVASTSR
jgi:glycosyltransferase involved in cell wall biosynthesis